MYYDLDKNAVVDMLHNLACTIKRFLRFYSYCLHNPQSADMLLWLAEIWEQFSTKIAKNSFTGSSYVYKNGIDYSDATDSESDSS